MHDSTQESIFYLLHERDSRLMDATVIITLPLFIVMILSHSAWNTAKFIKGAQNKLKRAHNRNARDRYYKAVDHIMIHMLSAMTGKAWKLVCPYHGPFCVLSTTLELFISGYPVAV